MAIRPYWTGQIQISLVQFGVKLFVATEAKSEIRFHQISRSTGERVRHQKILASAVDNPAPSGESDAPSGPAPVVEKNEIVKGYEYRKGEYITIEPKELDQLRVPSKHTMEITQFVDASDIDPEFFEKPYFVIPENNAQSQAFAVVRQALKETKKVALTKIAFAGREHVVALTPTQDDSLGGMMAYTMRYAQELRDPKEYFADVKKPAIDEDSLSLAKELIKRKAAKFDPSKFVDGYEVALKELVEAKIEHAPIPQDEPAEPARGKVINLMDALRKSVSSVKAEDVEDEAPVPTPKKKASAKGAELKKGITLVKSDEAKSDETKSDQVKSKPAKTATRRKSA